MASHGVPRRTQPRTDEQRDQELDKIQKYRALEDQIRRKVALQEFDRETFGLSSKLLRLNPEYYTVWNIRRRCLKCSIFHDPSRAAGLDQDSTERPAEASGREAEGVEPAKRDEDIIRSELTFTIPLLMEFPKCYWIWKYRSWMLNEAINKLSVSSAKTIWEEELGLVGKMLHRDRRNFHAWGYRRGVVAQLESSTLQGNSLVESEFDYTTSMIHVDLSNFSAWHNRSQLIPRLLKERNADNDARRLFLQKELETVHNALNVGPEDQSLWYYHHFLMHSIVEASGDGLLARDLTNEERRRYFDDEIDFVKDLLEDYEEVKWIYEALTEHTITASRLMEQGLESDDEKNLSEWLQKLRELDPKRVGRWHELCSRLGIS